MKNISIVLVSAFIGVLSGCSSTQDAGSTGATPTPTVTVASVEPPPASDKPQEDKPTGPEETPPPEEAAPAGRLALQQCPDEARKVKKCSTEARKVCAEVDTGIRCVRAPCPSTAQQTYDNPCMACMNSNVRGYWPMSCEDMAKPTAP